MTSGTPEVVNRDKMVAKQATEERKFAEMMMPKKNKRLYKKIMYSKKKKAQEVTVCILV